jgi:peptide/nickel transport system permease protein
MTRGQYIARRIAFALATVLLALVVNFFIFRAAPGDPTSQLLARPGVSAAYVQHLRHVYGVDQPLWTQFANYVAQLAQGNFGVSTSNHQLVSSNLMTALLNTLPMVAIGTLIAILLGLLAGVLLAWMRETKLEGPGLLGGLVTYALPSQWVGLVLLAVFAGVLPAGGIRDEFLIDPSPLARATDELRHMILPAATLALAIFGQYTFIVRSAMLDVLGADYMLTARAKGLSTRRILVHHGLRNALLPISSLTALLIGGIVGGAVLVETVFSWPGIGRATAQAVASRDYPTLQGAFLVITLSVVLCNLFVDLIAVKLDPRVTQ